ncbi:MAG: hypothetical protein IPL65_10920 [Lewinellaceae bacterium]|nr:hypothetical protein [Lewinellaceae bacterium]
MRLFSTLLLLSLGFTVTAQCPITVDAGEDQFSCFPPTPVTLNGNIDGPYLNFMWTPLTGMSGSNTLTPSVTTATTANYVLKATAIDYSTNLIFNGDFEQGNVGFTSDYDYNPGFTGPPFGSYEIAPNPTFAFWAQCPDHTSGSGNYMIIDGSDVPNELLWCQTVSVVPNSTYVLSTWITSTNGAAPLANIRFTINGTVVGIKQAPSQTCNWVQFSTTWNSGSSTTADICLEDITVTGANNDFAIDDVALYPVCTVTDTVTVNVITVQAVASPIVALIPCAGASYTLNGTGSSTGPNISYLWETFDGNVVSGANTLMPVVNQAGSYTLTVSYDYGSGQCTKTATVNVIESPNPLSTWTNIPQPLEYDGTSVALNGFANQGTVNHQWSTANGNILSGSASSTAVVDQPGTYNLLVTNYITGCTATAQVSVTTANSPPAAVAMATGIYSCIQNQIPLSGVGSSAGAGIVYSWSSPNGAILSGQDSILALAGA